MECMICGGNAVTVVENKKARYRDEVVDVQREAFRCASCEEEFVTPEQARVYVRNVRNEVRKKYGLLSPERIAEIRRKLQLTQAELEELLNAGSKVVVRWESGKVIQSGAHDAILRLLEQDPSMLERLKQIQQTRSMEKKEYEAAHTDQSRTKVACA
ncbi:MAG TPA: type II TA system antitoxin MqsA family protein [Terriglobales bacterium]|nr:type II TA system antitoxin MqsA family protein [Terriglobales bacterium]